MRLGGETEILVRTYGDAKLCKPDAPLTFVLSDEEVANQVSGFFLIPSPTFKGIGMHNSSDPYFV